MIDGESDNEAEIRELVPESLLELLRIPGLGPKKVRTIYENLEMVDRVGGGDNFSAGLISSLLEGKGPQDAIDFAGAYSALAHTFPGDVNWATRAEAESAMRGEAARIKR